MFKKRLLCLLLSLSLLFGLPPSAHAQSVPYTPGEITNQLLRDAFLSGNMVCADVHIALQLNPDALMLTGDDAKAVEIICEILRDAQLTIGAAQIPNSIALLLRATYGSEPVSADLIFILTDTGIFIETSLLPGEQISILWETALAAAGLDESAISMVLSLRDTDPTQIMQLITQSIELGKTMISMTSAPYLQIINDFIAAQPVETQYNIAAEGYFPAASHESVRIITQKSIGSLLVSLCAKLEQDATLAPLLDSALMAVSGDPSVNTAALCTAIREASAAMTDEQYPFFFVTGYDDAAAPLYYSLCTSDDMGISYALNLIDIADTIDQETTGYLLQAFVSDEQTFSGLSASYLLADSAADPNVRAFGAAAEFDLANDRIFSAEYSVSTQPSATADSQPAYETAEEFALDMTMEGQMISLICTSQSEHGRTADGGEYANSASTTESYLGSIPMSQTTEVSNLSLSPAENGLTGTFNKRYTSPQEGVDEAAISCRFYAAPYSPADNPMLHIPGVTSEDAIDAMLLRLKHNAELVLSAWVEQLPESIRQQIISSDSDQSTPTTTP